jgi:hypothetical protein
MSQPVVCGRTLVKIRCYLPELPVCLLGSRRRPSAVRANHAREAVHLVYYLTPLHLHQDPTGITSR